MGGILLLILVLGWAAVTLRISKWVVARLSKIGHPFLIGIGVYLLLLPLPLIDDIVGGLQFRILCAENSSIVVNRGSIVSKTVYFSSTSDIEIKGTAVRVVAQPLRYLDSSTNNVIVGYSNLRAAGGWLMRTLTEGGVPATFSGYCSPLGRDGPDKLFKDLGLSRISSSAIGK